MRLFLAFLIFCVINFAIKKLSTRKIRSLLIFNSLVFCALFVVGILGAGGVISDAYERLEIFKSLEESSQLGIAKADPKAYCLKLKSVYPGSYSMLETDLRQFNSSAEFAQYITDVYEASIPAVENVLLGLILASCLELLIWLKCKLFP